LGKIKWRRYNRQILGRFIKDELQGCGGYYKPCDWRNFATKNVQVSYDIKGKKGES